MVAKHTKAMGLSKDKVRILDLACGTGLVGQELARLGFGNIVGSPRPGGTIGLFIDDYLVWARTPPRGSRKGDPAFGDT